MYISASSPLARLGFIPFALSRLQVMVVILGHSLVSLVVAVGDVLHSWKSFASLRGRELDTSLN